MSEWQPLVEITVRGVNAVGRAAGLNDRQTVLAAAGGGGPVIRARLARAIGIVEIKPSRQVDVMRRIAGYYERGADTEVWAGRAALRYTVAVQLLARGAADGWLIRGSEYDFKGVPAPEIKAARLWAFRLRTLKGDPSQVDSRGMLCVPRETFAAYGPAALRVAQRLGWIVEDDAAWLFLGVSPVDWSTGVQWCANGR